MVEYLTYCRGLLFEAKPDYSYLRRVLRTLFKRNHFTHDIVFDWNLIKISGNDGATAGPGGSPANGNNNLAVAAAPDKLGNGQVCCKDEDGSLQRGE